MVDRHLPLSDERCGKEPKESKKEKRPVSGKKKKKKKKGRKQMTPE
jgi:hypothetical protein